MSNVVAIGTYIAACNLHVIAKNSTEDYIVNLKVLRSWLNAMHGID